MRGRWQDMANTHLEQLGHSARIDMRSHAERGTGLEPEKKQLPSQWRRAGRENVIEFRQVRAELMEAQGNVQRLVPHAPAEIISLEAERHHRAQEQEKAEQVRIGRMSSAELRTEIERIRPPEVSEVVASDPEVMASWQLYESLSGQMKQAEATMEKAQQEMKAWRDIHPLRAKVHDLGLVQSKFLAEREEIRETAWTKSHELFPQVNDDRQHAEFTENAAERRTQAAQMPMCERIGELEQIWQQKARQEQAQRRQELNLNRAMSSLKVHARMREMKAHGYTDTGKEWKALPEKVRGWIDAYNRKPEKARPQALEQLRERLKHNPQEMEKFTKELNLARGRGRGGGRG